MGSRAWKPVAAALVAAVLLVGCGGGGKGTTAQGANASASASRQGRASEPTGSSGDRSIQTWGVESSRAQRRAATLTVRAYLDARADHAYGRACSALEDKLRAEMREIAGDAPCAEVMADLASRSSVAVLREEAKIKPLSFRVGADDSFLIYRRSDGTFAMPLVRRGNGWSLGLMTPSQIE